MIELKERIAELVGTESVASYARRIGIQHDKIRQWMRGGRTPSIEDFTLFCEAAGANPLWLAIGIGSRDDPFSFSGKIKDRIQKTCSCENLSELARIAKIPRGTLGSYATGTNTPRLDNLIRIAMSANVSLSWLLTGQGQERPFEGTAKEAPKPAPPTLPTAPSKAQPMDEISEIRDLLKDVSTLSEVCHERHEVHAVAHIRRDLDALIREIHRLYPDILRPFPSENSGVA